MAKRSGFSIPYWLWGVIGVFIAGYSKVIQLKDPGNAAMSLFFWIGVVFIAVAVSKFLLGNVAKKAEVEDKQIVKEFTPKVPGGATVACPRCKAPNWAASNFCYSCGLRLR